MKRGHSVDMVFGLVLFGLFAVLVLMVLMSGAGAYQGIEDSMQSHFDQRTVISYLAEKVRHYDAAGCVAVETIGGQEALCLYEEIEEETYCTQIYVYDGMLMELFAEAGADLPPESGEAILAISDLQLELDGSLLQIECTGTDGETAELQLCLRAEGQVA